MLPSLHRYSIGLEYKHSAFGKEKIIGYLSPYSYSKNIYVGIMDIRYITTIDYKTIIYYGDKVESYINTFLRIQTKE